MGRYDFEFPPEYVIKDLCRAECKRERPTSKGELTVRCPIYKDKWIEINVANGGVWCCFRQCPDCPGNAKGGILDFYQLFFQCGSRKNAREQILESMEKNAVSVKRRQEEVVKPKKLSPIANPDMVDKTYRAFLELLPLSKEHLKDLRKRGLSDEDIKVVGFRSVPQIGTTVIAHQLVNAGHVIKGVPGFYETNGQPKMNCNGSGYFIPYRDSENRIIALQIRKDVKITDAMSEEDVLKVKKRRYRWFTSSGEESGCSASNVPFYGIPDKERKDVAYCTEGGLKASVAQSLSSGWFVAIPGISCFEAWKTLLEYLKSQNVTTIVDVFDTDRISNPIVANNIKKLHTIALEHGYEMKEWNWDAKYKGVDDFLLSQKKKRKKDAV